MKKIILATILLFACFANSMAQQAKIGYFSYSKVLSAMPEYAVAQANLDSLRNQYAAEMKAAENEFNEKYELFLEQQSTLADAIRRKRQSDLQALLDRNTMFRNEAERLLAQAEKEALTPIKEKIAAAIKQIGDQEGYIAILNTDSEACPYLHPNFAEDVTDKILAIK